MRPMHIVLKPTQRVWMSPPSVNTKEPTNRVPRLPIPENSKNSCYNGSFFTHGLRCNQQQGMSLGFALEYLPKVFTMHKIGLTKSTNLQDSNHGTQCYSIRIVEVRLEIGTSYQSRHDAGDVCEWVLKSINEEVQTPDRIQTRQLFRWIQMSGFVRGTY
jgi:hypothetical protein